MPNATWTPKATYTALCIVGLGLFANAAAIYFAFANRFPDIINQPAYAQAAPGQMLGARGIYMMPAQLGPTSFGFYIMDVDSSTVCVYRTLPETSRLKFIASRSFKNDRFLEDFNNDVPTPKDVQKMVQKQRERIDEENKSKEPTVDQTPPATAPAPQP